MALQKSKSCCMNNEEIPSYFFWFRLDINELSFDAVHEKHSKKQIFEGRKGKRNLKHAV